MTRLAMGAGHEAGRRLLGATVVFLEQDVLVDPVEYAIHRRLGEDQAALGVSHAVDHYAGLRLLVLGFTARHGVIPCTHQNHGRGAAKEDFVAQQVGAGSCILVDRGHASSSSWSRGPSAWRLSRCLSSRGPRPRKLARPCPRWPDREGYPASGLLQLLRSNSKAAGLRPSGRRACSERRGLKGAAGSAAVLSTRPSKVDRGARRRQRSSRAAARLRNSSGSGSGTSGAVGAGGVVQRQIGGRRLVGMSASHRCRRAEPSGSTKPSRALSPSSAGLPSAAPATARRGLLPHGRAACGTVRL